MIFWLTPGMRSRSAINAQGNPVRIHILPEYVQFEFSGISVQLQEWLNNTDKDDKQNKTNKPDNILSVREMEAVWTQGRRRRLRNSNIPY
ncbi:hypothetical protein MJ588_16275 [Klebsiella pneumoniae]|nr:hypothetical protein MJ588_16275 [Klebsiella pneumoniae]